MWPISSKYKWFLFIEVVRSGTTALKLNGTFNDKIYARHEITHKNDDIERSMIDCLNISCVFH